jgi:transcriptional regulator with XRE-family HTH domain
MTTVLARRRMVGGALRRYRENLGWPLADAARILDCDRSKISRIECGWRGIAPRDLGFLLAAYGVTGKERDIVLELSRPRPAAAAWCTAFAHVLGEEARDYLALEACTGELLVWDPAQIPAMVQIPQYAQAIAAASPGLVSDELSAVLATLQAARSTALVQRQPRLSIVLGEAALWQQTGGPGVLASQLTWLAVLIDAHPAVSLRIVPFDSGAHAAGMLGPVTLVQFLGAPVLSAACLPAAPGLCLTDPDSTAVYLRMFAELGTCALDQAASLAMLRTRAAELSDQADAEGPPWA